jgi:A/G-specific adenine glycosylase
MSGTQAAFADRIVEWQRRSGRHELPWQNTRDPYRIWLSEVMLQQTQVSTVIPYFQRFLVRFPDVASLANASLDEVLALWSGLGYYSRGRNLHRAARQVIDRHGGVFPTRVEDLEALPGVGRSTAAAIAVFSTGARHAILDGNVKRVLARAFAVEGYPGETAVQKRLWGIAEALLPESDVETYTQGLMDLGATVCARTRPPCAACPVKELCAARRAGSVESFPAARPRKPRRQRTTVMLIATCESEVLLERRPASGIWGGLWSFPEFESEAAALQASGEAFGLDIEAHEALLPIAHAFTHFDLTIVPLVCSVRVAPTMAQEGPSAWWRMDDALNASIPAPVRTLLLQIGRAAPILIPAR